MSKPLVLILCTGNSCRSQMAEGFLREAAGDGLEVASAGSTPSGYVHPSAVVAMQEVGIDISSGTSKHMNEFLDRNVETIITVCGNADQACPEFPGQINRYHWPFVDPAYAEGTDEEKMQVFRQVRDEIRQVFTAYALGRVDGRREVGQQRHHQYRVKAYQIFQSLSPELGTTIFEDLRENHRDVYKSILVSIAQEKRLRPVFVQRKPVVQQIKWMGDSCKLRPCNSVAEHLLQIWLLKSQQEMLKSFLDDLGIEHDDEGTAEDLPDELEPKKLKSAVDGLLKKYPRENVALYLHVFQLQQSGGWSELSDLLEKDDRLALGEAKPEPEEVKPEPEEAAPATEAAAEQIRLALGETPPEHGGMNARFGIAMTVALSALVGCFSEPEPDASPSAPDSPAPAPVVTESFPITRSLVDNKDRTIEAHLIGRSDSHVRFYRLGTSTREIFTYPIKNLSVEDQVFLARLPTTFSQPLDTTEVPTTAERAREVRLRNLDLEIARQEERIEEVQQRLHPDMPNSQRKAVKNEIIRKVAELKKLEERKKEILAQP